MSLNKVMVIGHLGRDPECRQGATNVTAFSVATTEKWTKDGNTQERTEWHNVTTFGKLADVCAKYLAKGKQVYVEGKLQTDEWEKDGVKKRATKIIASDVRFLSGGKSERSEERGEGSGVITPLSDSDMSKATTVFDDDDIPF